MICVSEKKVLCLHRMLCEATGGDSGLRDEGLLESALAAAFATFDGRELYKTVEEKAARLGYSLVANHAFVDGNKRIGVLVMLTYLEVNGMRLQLTDADIVSLGLGVAAGTVSYEDLLAFIRAHRA